MASTSSNKTAIQKQIEELQNRLKELDQEAIHELKLKLSDARKGGEHPGGGAGAAHGEIVGTEGACET
jgi:hypothetical protein